MQGMYNYVPETNHVSRVYRVSQAFKVNISGFNSRVDAESKTSHSPGIKTHSIDLKLPGHPV